MAAPDNLKHIVEAALLAAGGPLSLDGLQALFEEHELPDKTDLREVLGELTEDYRGRGIEIVEVASGWRIQVVGAVSRWVSRLWSERPARYSRALMETLALIAYRQPITRGEIEDIRGVSVSSNIIKTLLEREWIRVLGHRDVPGKPSLYGTTREFLDYFNLKTLDELPTLAEIRDLDEINRELDLKEDSLAQPLDAGSTEAVFDPAEISESGSESAELVSAEGRGESVEPTPTPGVSDVSTPDDFTDPGPAAEPLHRDQSTPISADADASEQPRHRTESDHE